MAGMRRRHHQSGRFRSKAALGHEGAPVTSLRDVTENLPRRRRRLKRLGGGSEERLAGELSATQQLQSVAALLTEGGCASTLNEKTLDAARPSPNPAILRCRRSSRWDTAPLADNLISFVACDYRAQPVALRLRLARRSNRSRVRLNAGAVQAV
jgi:hypothetical protein